MSKKKPKIELPTEEEIEKFGATGAKTSRRDEAAAPDEAPHADDKGATSPTELESLRQELEEARDKLLRAKAENQNLLRRTAIEKSEAIRYANEAFVKALLAVADDFERTLKAAQESGNAEAVVEGVRLVYDKMMKVMRDNHVTLIEALGKPFDPTYHNVALQQPSGEHEPGTVIRELQKGYCLRDRVVRPTHVIVAAAQGEAESKPQPESGDDATDGE